MPKIKNEAIEELKKENAEKKKKITYEKLLILISLIATIILILVFISINNKTRERLKKEEEIPSYAQNFNKENFKEVKNQVKGESEIKRIKTYLGDIFEKINKQEYR